MPLKVNLFEPETICSKPRDEQLIVVPDICEVVVESCDDTVLMCACCDKPMTNKPMTDASHTCTLNTSSDTITDVGMDDRCIVEQKVPKLNQVYDLGSNPYFTYCSFATNSTKIHSSIEYHLCTNCMSYICSHCLDRYFRWNDPNCCENPNVPHNKYNGELKPK